MTGTSRSLKDRFDEKVEKLDSGCWKWKGVILPQGYGQIRRGEGINKMVRAHRVGYELYKGQIPEGLQIDHLCRNRWCVNPDHLEAVTHRENSLRGNSPTATIYRTGICKRGHVLSQENTRFKSDGTKQCRTCLLENMRARRQATPTPTITHTEKE